MTDQVVEDKKVKIFILPSMHSDASEAGQLKAVVNRLKEKGRVMILVEAPTDSEEVRNIMANAAFMPEKRLRYELERAGFLFTAGAEALMKVLSEEKHNGVEIKAIDMPNNGKGGYAEVKENEALNAIKQHSMVRVPLYNGLRKTSGIALQFILGEADYLDIRNGTMLKHIEEEANSAGAPASIVVWTGAAHAIAIEKGLKEHGFDAEFLHENGWEMKLALAKINCDALIAAEKLAGRAVGVHTESMTIGQMKIVQIMEVRTNPGQIKDRAKEVVLPVTKYTTASNFGIVFGKQMPYEQLQQLHACNNPGEVERFYRYTVAVPYFFRSLKNAAKIFGPLVIGGAGIAMGFGVAPLLPEGTVKNLVSSTGIGLSFVGVGAVLVNMKRSDRKIEAERVKAVEKLVRYRDDPRTKEPDKQHVIELLRKIDPNGKREAAIVKDDAASAAPERSKSKTAA